VPQEATVYATELYLGSEPAPDYRLVRWELFLFRDVRDVLAGPRAGTVVVIHRGPEQSDLWLAELRESGLLRSAAQPRTDT
jgi:hypothetical protein